MLLTWCECIGAVHLVCASILILPLSKSENVGVEIYFVAEITEVFFQRCSFDWTPRTQESLAHSPLAVYLIHHFATTASVFIYSTLLCFLLVYQCPNTEYRVPSHLITNIGVLTLKRAWLEKIKK